MTSIQDNQFQRLWDTQMSAYVKSLGNRESFIANWTFWRAQLGAVRGSKLIATAYSQDDALTGRKGQIYTFDYLNSYDRGDRYLRIVLEKENDGVFRMGGFWNTPAKR